MRKKKFIHFYSNKQEIRQIGYFAKKTNKKTQKNKILLNCHSTLHYTGLKSSFHFTLEEIIVEKISERDHFTASRVKIPRDKHF